MNNCQATMNEKGGKMAANVWTKFLLKGFLSMSTGNFLDIILWWFYRTRQLNPTTWIKLHKPQSYI